MLLTEYQSKTILQRHGINTPQGQLVHSAEEAAAVAGEFGGWPLVLKAQIPAGGRARGYFKSPAAPATALSVDTAVSGESAVPEGGEQNNGGIRVVNNVEETESAAREMLGRHLVTGQTGPQGNLVRQLYLESHARIQHEYFLALTIDAHNGQIVFLVSNQGGTLVEQASQKNPHAITSIPLGADALQATAGTARARLPTAEILEALDLNESFGAGIEKLLAIMLQVFVERDATLIELNPFGFTAAGELLVLDAAIQWDDNALFRQGHEEELVAYDSLSVAEHDARVARLNYHDLDGNIGTLGFGAAVAMATNDALVSRGARPANFLDVAPSADPERIRAGIDVLLANPQVEAILINAFGGGILRCSSVCDALVQADAGHSLADCGKVFVVRLAGVEAEAAVEYLKATLPSVIVCGDLREAVEETIKRAPKVSLHNKHKSLQGNASAVQRLRSLIFGPADSSGKQSIVSTNGESNKVEKTD